MEIQSFIDSPVFQETAAKFRNKAHEEAKQAFEDFIELQHDQPKVAASDVTEFVDNGVKSTLFLGRLDSHLNSASYAIDEADFKVNQGKRMNYYSTQKWDIGVYQDNSSTESNPSVLVSVDESESGGSRKIYRVHVNEVNMKDAACYEMFGAICYKTENWFDALSSFKWALDDNYGMDRVNPDGSRPACHVEQQLHPYDRLNFEETFRIAVERLTANYDERLENVRTTLLNMINNVDNGVKSTLLMGRIDSQKTEQKQVSGSMSTIYLTDEEVKGWHNGKKPEGWRFTGAGGVIFSGGTKAYHDYFNVYYTDGAENDYSFGVFYDENSPEDNPVVYLRKTVASTYSELDTTETIKVEVNKINPSNATYEEMIALVGYIYRDDELAASEASFAVDMAREAMQADGLDWQNGTHDYTGYYLPEIVRRYKEYDPELSQAADMLMDYLKDYPR